MSQQKNHQRGPRVSYDTPDRECVHADKGCCPACYDPMKPRVLKGFTLESIAHTGPAN